MTAKAAISDQAFRDLVHPLQRRRFILAMVFATILFPVVVVLIVVGTVWFLLVPILAFFIWVGGRVFFARLLGNAILVSEVNYPRINTITEELKAELAYDKPTYVFVYEQGHFNAYLMMRLFHRRAIFLNSELLESGVSDDEVRWLIGRFIGYMRARRQAGFPGLMIRGALHLLIFNVFLLPYERALVYTGDRLALSVIDGDISSAVSAMQKLLVGRQLGYSVNPQGIVDQQRQVKGSIFAFLARMMTAFPHLTSRYVDLVVFAQSRYPQQFAKFEAANPGLPADISQLIPLLEPTHGTSPAAPLPEPAGGPTLVPQPAVAVGARSNRVAWYVTAGVASVLVIGGAWFLLAPSKLAPSAPAESVTTPQSPTTPAETVTTPPRPTTNPFAPITPSVPSASPALPPHVHIDAQGNLAPDAGCDWVSPAPDDFRVRCQ